MALLELVSISKSFPGVQALREVSLAINSGEVLALIGENGAGKSTLIKAMAGVHKPDEGDIFFEGEKVIFESPADSKRLGIGVIFQELNIIPGLSVRDNLFLGNEKSLGFTDSEVEKKRGTEILKSLGANFSLNDQCGSLSIAQQQLVEISRSLLLENKLIVMDEPTASLANKDVEHLFRVIQQLTDKGIAILYVSHKLEEVEELADRIMILRDGVCVDTQPKSKLNRDQMIEIMVGRKLENEFPPRSNTIKSETVLEAHNLRWGNLIQGVSLNLKRGEILGIAGLVGAGRTELIRLISGASKPSAGTIKIEGSVKVCNTPLDAMINGIGLIPEDRKGQGLILEHGVDSNFDLLNLRENSKHGFIQFEKLKSSLKKYQDKLEIKFSDESQPVKFLSGGNQQKVVIAKWLKKDCNILIFDEPTRGIDVGAKYEIYEIINSLTESGKTIIMVSSELPELLGLADRLVVMKNGEISGEFESTENVTQEQVMQLCF